MASNDDALAATALALNEDSKAKRGRKPPSPKPEPTPASDGRQTFALKDQDLTDFRAAMADDDAADHDEASSPVVKFWKRMAAAHGFDPETLVMTAIPDDGPIEFTAIATTPGVNQPAATTAEPDDDDDDQDAEAAQSRGHQLMEQAAADMDLASETLVGDLTAGILNIVQNMQKPWSAHSQFEKRDTIQRIEHIAKIVARKAVDVVAADDRITVKAILDKITIGDKVQMNLTLGAMSDDEKAEAVAQLFHAQKKSVLIVTADADRHMGRRRELVEDDEEELPFDAGTDPKPKAAAQPSLTGPAGDNDLVEAADNPESNPDPDAEPKPEAE